MGLARKYQTMAPSANRGRLKRIVKTPMEKETVSAERIRGPTVRNGRALRNRQKGHARGDMESAALPLQRKCTSRTASVSRPLTVEHIACGGSAVKRADVVDRSTARTSALRRMYLKSSVISGAANLRQTGRWSPSPVNAATVATATVTTGNVKQGRCFVVPSTREAGVVWESLWVCSDRSDCSYCLVEWRLFLMTSSRGRHRRGTAERF